MGGTHGLSQGPPPTVPGGTPSILPGPGGGPSESPLREPGQLPRHPHGAGSVLCQGQQDAGGVVPAPLGDGAGRGVSLKQAAENPGSTGAPGQSTLLRLPTWKAVPRRVVKGLPGAGPGEGLPSLPLEAGRPLWVRSHSAPGSTPVGSHRGSVGQLFPRRPAVWQRQSLRPGGRLVLLPLLCPR